MIPQSASQGEIIKFKSKNCTKSTCAGKILIVEDEEDLAVLLEYNLKKGNYQVFLAGDGRKALQDEDK